MSLRPYHFTGTSTPILSTVPLLIKAAIPKIRTLHDEIWLLETHTASPQLDHNTLACLKLWLTKAYFIIDNILHPNRTQLSKLPDKATATTKAKYYSQMQEDLDFLQSDFLEEILEIAGCLDLKK